MDASTLLAIAAVNQSIKPVIETGAKLVDSLLGEPFKIAGAMLGDQIYCWRIQRMFGMASKAKKLLVKAGIEPKQLPVGFLLPLLESASIVDDETIHDLFAKLLASAVSDDIYQHPKFRKVIGELCADEARILSAAAVQETHIYIRTDADEVFGIRDEAFVDTTLLQLQSPGRFDFYFSSLSQLGLLSAEAKMHVVSSDSLPPSILMSDRFKSSETRTAHGTAYWRRRLALTDAGALIGKLASQSID